MSEIQNPSCPECEHGLDRRAFLWAVGAQAAAATLIGGPRSVIAAAPAKASRPAEELVKELFSTLTPEQKTAVVLPYDHGAADGKALPTRLGMYNRPIANKTIEDNYKPAQRELVERILKAISSGDEGYRRLSRNGSFDGSGSLEGCGALLFGEPVDGKEWSWVFSGHHLTVRCDGRPDDGVGFGGPLYYGHSPNGYSEKNVFYYQTKSVLSVFDALDEKQRKQAIVAGTPGEGPNSIKFRAARQPHPGLPLAELSADQKQLVEKVMKDVLSPFRQEDADEVVRIVKAAGGIGAIHLAFYRPAEAKADERWHFWRLEGPGFVWNFRVLPHVHTYVNVVGKI